jgi:NADPH:quinone reductase
MKAIRVSRAGGPEVMELAEVPTPKPGPREATVRVEAAGVNFIDTYYRSGAYPREAPFGLGEEGAGVVESVGPDGDDGANGGNAATAASGTSGTSGASGGNAATAASGASVSVGDRVAWASANGSYATHVVARVDRLVPVPDGVSTQHAAAVMLQGMTADYLARSTFALAAGHTCVVHAAAGGVGLLLVQMAKRAGARVIGTTSTEAKARLAREAGADEVLLHDEGPFDEAVRGLTAGRGADVVYDGIGQSTFEQSLRALRPRGMLVLFGQSSGRVPPLDLQVLAARGSLFVTRPTLRDYVATRAELLERAGRVLGAVARGELTVRIHEAYPLARAADAHRDLASRATTGKLLLVAQA